MFHFKSWLMDTPSNLALVTNSRGLPFRTRGSKRKSTALTLPRTILYDQLLVACGEDTVEWRLQFEIQIDCKIANCSPLEIIVDLIIHHSFENFSYHWDNWNGVITEAPNDCFLSVRRSEYCLEFSFAWGRLKISTWTFHLCSIFEAYLYKFPTIFWSLTFHIFYYPGYTIFLRKREPKIF